MRCRKQFLAMALALTILYFPIWNLAFCGERKSETQMIKSLISKYGKRPIIELILNKRNLEITIRIGDKYESFLGLPNEAYVTPTTILIDLKKMGMVVRNLEDFFKQQKKNIEHTTIGKEEKSPTSHSRSVFKEKELSSLKWGMSVDSFKRSNYRPSELAEIISGHYYKDMYLPFHGHTSIAGFRFGEKGLDHIVISYIFRTQGKQLYQKDILRISKRILQELTQAYGKPTYNYPWNEQNFNFMWLGNVTYVQFAWDGGDSWGIQLRSMELDPEIKTLMKRLKKGR